MVILHIANGFDADLISVLFLTERGARMFLEIIYGVWNCSDYEERT
jgi:hypothetical protein